MVGENLEARDIVLHRRNDRLQRVYETHRPYDSLQYPIIFWKGEMTVIKILFYLQVLKVIKKLVQ